MNTALPFMRTMPNPSPTPVDRPRVGVTGTGPTMLANVNPRQRLDRSPTTAPPFGQALREAAQRRREAPATSDIQTTQASQSANGTTQEPSQATRVEASPARVAASSARNDAPQAKPVESVGEDGTVKVSVPDDTPASTAEPVPDDGRPQDVDVSADEGPTPQLETPVFEPHAQTPEIQHPEADVMLPADETPAQADADDQAAAQSVAMADAPPREAAQPLRNDPRSHGPRASAARLATNQADADAAMKPQTQASTSATSTATTPAPPAGDALIVTAATTEHDGVATTSSQATASGSAATTPTPSTVQATGSTATAVSVAPAPTAPPPVPNVAPTATPLPTLPEPQSPEESANLARVTRGLQSAINQQGGAVTLRMTPPELGTVRIELSIQGTNVTARLHAESDSIRDLLSQQLNQLRHGLERQGLNVERLSVQTQQPGQGSANQQNAQHSPQDGRSRGEYAQQQQHGGRHGDDAPRDGRDPNDDRPQAWRRRFEQFLLNTRG